MESEESEEEEINDEVLDYFTNMDKEMTPSGGEKKTKKVLEFTSFQSKDN